MKSSACVYRSCLAALLAAFPALQILNLSLISNTSTRVFVSNSIQALSALAAAFILNAACQGLHRQRSDSAVSWRLIFYATCLWAMGMVSFMFVEVVLQKAPYPGFPDLFFILCYPFMMVGLWKLPSEKLTDGERLNTGLDIGALVIITVLVIWQFNLQNLIENLAKTSDSGSLMSLVYTLLDVMLLIILFSLLVRRLSQGNQFLPLLLLVLGCFCLIVSDSMQAYITTHTSFTSGSPTDIGWVLFSTLTGFSGLAQMAAMEPGGNATSRPGRSGATQAICVMIILYLWAGIMLFILILGMFLPEKRHPFLFAAGIVAAVCLVMIRQTRNVLENTRLNGCLRRQNENLEQLVENRTSELAAINAELKAEILVRKQAQEEARASASKYQGIVDTSREWIWMMDSTGRFTYTNPTVLKILGQPPEDVLSQGFALLHPEDREVLMALLQEKHLTKGGWSELVLRWRHRDGSYRFLESNAVAVLDIKGDLAGFQGSDRDITTRKQVEEANTQLAGQLRQAQKIEALGTLAGGIAHDFNNILSVIIGFSELARAEAKDHPMVLECLEQIDVASSRAKELTAQILTFTRKNKQERRPIVVQPVIKQCMKLLRSTLPTMIEIECQIDEEPAMVMADATQIHQVLMNLCVNAAHAMRGKTGCLSVSYGRFEADETAALLCPGLRPGTWLRLIVSDTGHGMDPETIRKIFDPFFTTKASGEGTGLGLAVVLGIVNDHEGAIRVDSQPGEGTTFQIFLPKCQTSGEEPQQMKAEIPRGSGERILFVDDEAALCESSKRLLESSGYSVTAFSKPSDALTHFRLGPSAFDLVISDLSMPVMTGVELATSILTIRSDIPVVLTSGFAGQTTSELASAAGIREVINKPVTPSSLGMVLNRLLQAKKSAGHTLASRE